MPSEESLMTISDVLKNCNKEVSVKEAETIIAKQNTKTVDQKCRETRGVSVDLKKLINSVATMKNSEETANRIDKIDNVIEELHQKSKPLEKAMNSELFSTESELLEVCIGATKETLYNMNGVASLDPNETGDKFVSFIDGIRKSMKHRRPDRISGEDINELLVLDEEDDDSPCEMFDDEHLERSKRFANRLGFLDEHYGEIEIWCGRNREKMFGKDTARHVVSRSLQPALWENCDTIESMLALVKVTKFEKEKKKRDKVDKDGKKDKAELVTLSDKANATVQQGEVSILKELKHVKKSLKATLKSRGIDSIGYYEFILDPKDFFKTVENMFYISYLVRDKEVYLVLEDDVPTLKNALDIDERSRLKLEEECVFHGIAQLGYSQWIELKELFKNKKACIPPKEI